MEEWGIDILGHTSDHVDEYLNNGMNIVITLCDSAEELCPTFPGKVERIHWSIPDPFTGWTEDNRFVESYREARNLIRNHLQAFLKDH